MNTFQQSPKQNKVRNLKQINRIIWVAAVSKNRIEKTKELGNLDRGLVGLPGLDLGIWR